MKNFKIGDEVKVRGGFADGLFGEIIGFDGECWVVDCGGNIVECWGSQLTKQPK